MGSIAFTSTNNTPQKKRKFEKLFKMGNLLSQDANEPTLTKPTKLEAETKPRTEVTSLNAEQKAKLQAFIDAIPDSEAKLKAKAEAEAIAEAEAKAIVEAQLKAIAEAKALAEAEAKALAEAEAKALAKAEAEALAKAEAEALAKAEAEALAKAEAEAAAAAEAAAFEQEVNQFTKTAEGDLVGQVIAALTPSI